MDKLSCLALMTAILKAPDLARPSGQCLLEARRIYEAIESKLSEILQGLPKTPA